MRQVVIAVLAFIGSCTRQPDVSFIPLPNGYVVKQVASVDTCTICRRDNGVDIIILSDDLKPNQPHENSVVRYGADSRYVVGSIGNARQPSAIGAYFLLDTTTGGVQEVRKRG